MMRKIVVAAVAAFIAFVPPLAFAQTPPAAAPVTQNTVTTTGPVSSNTEISVGTIAGQVLAWAVAAFGGVTATAGTALLIRLFKNAGISGADMLSDQLNKTLLNGLNDAASRLAVGLQGQGTVQVKNQVVMQAIDYAKAHRAETIQALGLDPNSGKTIEALRGRIATLVADPNSPTPAVLGGPAAPIPPAPPAPPKVQA